MDLGWSLDSGFGMEFGSWIGLVINLHFLDPNFSVLDFRSRVLDLGFWVGFVVKLHFLDPNRLDVGLWTWGCGSWILDWFGNTTSLFGFKLPRLDFGSRVDFGFWIGLIINLHFWDPNFPIQSLLLDVVYLGVLHTILDTDSGRRILSLRGWNFF